MLCVDLEYILYEYELQMPLSFKVRAKNYMPCLAKEGHGQNKNRIFFRMV